MEPPTNYSQTKKLKRNGWEPLDNPPDWLAEKASDLRNSGKDVIDSAVEVRGDTFVYTIYFGTFNHGHDYRYFRKLKSDYHKTTRNKGTCPNCQAYVRRLEGDRFLTCHRCGWKVGLPILRWLRYPSWIDYYLGEIWTK